jgi:ABC-2 type transport system permease protein
MRGFGTLLWTEFKLIAREPYSTFFTIAFPLLMLFLFGAIYGNKPTPFFGGLGFVDVMVPAYIGMIIATTGMLSLTIGVASDREQGLLRRLRVTPLKPLAFLTAKVAVLFLLTALGMILLLIAGKIVYQMHFPAQPLNVLIAFVLSCSSFFALGFVIAGIMPTSRAAQIVSMVLYYPMLFLSGSTIPAQILPPGVRSFGRALPLTPVVNLMQGMWKGDAWSVHGSELIYLAVMFVVGLLVSAKTFRWE